MSRRESAPTAPPSLPPEQAEQLARSLDRLFFAFRKWNFRKWNQGVKGGSVIRLYLLDRLATSDEPWRMSDLAASLGVSARMMTSLVDGLESEGLVRRRVQPTDRRAMLVELTTSVAEARAPLIRYHLEAGTLFAGLSQDDQEAFLRVANFLVTQARAQEASAQER